MQIRKLLIIFIFSNVMKYLLPKVNEVILSHNLVKYVGQQEFSSHATLILICNHLIQGVHTTFSKLMSLNLP